MTSLTKVLWDAHSKQLKAERADGETEGYKFSIVDKPLIESLKMAHPVIDQIASRIFNRRFSGDVASRKDLHSQLELALGMFGDSVLTARESEVIRLYLAGHSTRSAAERLNISAHTVSMHDDDLQKVWQ